MPQLFFAIVRLLNAQRLIFSICNCAMSANIMNFFAIVRASVAGFHERPRASRKLNEF